jgi:hypothetical protein
MEVELTGTALPGARSVTAATADVVGVTWGPSPPAGRPMESRIAQVAPIS